MLLNNAASVFKTLKNRTVAVIQNEYDESGAHVFKLNGSLFSPMTSQEQALKHGSERLSCCHNFDTLIGRFI